MLWRRLTVGKLEGSVEAVRTALRMLNEGHCTRDAEAVCSPDVMNQIFKWKAEFPPNTNILYVDLPFAELVGSSKNVNSIPVMVLNTRKPIVYVDQFGRQ